LEKWIRCIDCQKLIAYSGGYRCPKIGEITSPAVLFAEIACRFGVKKREVAGA